MITLSGLLQLLFNFSLDELADRSDAYVRLNTTSDEEDALPASGSFAASSSSGTSKFEDQTCAQENIANA